MLQLPGTVNEKKKKTQFWLVYIAQCNMLQCRSDFVFKKKYMTCKMTYLGHARKAVKGQPPFLAIKRAEGVERPKLSCWRNHLRNLHRFPTDHHRQSFPPFISIHVNLCRCWISSEPTWLEISEIDIFSTTPELTIYPCWQHMTLYK